MFGNKEDKVKRLERIIKVLQQHPEGLSQSEIAAHIGVPSSTVARDLPMLEEHGILLQEDQGKLSYFAQM